MVELSPSGLRIEPGTVAGVRWTWDAYTGDRVFLTVVSEKTAVNGLGDDWRADAETPAWTVTLDADPSVVLTMTWPRGALPAESNVRLNAARAINFLPAMVAAEPGRRSVLDLKMISSTDAVR